MLRSDDVADKTFTTTHSCEGYEIAEVDKFRTALVDAISVRDHVIDDLQEELAQVRVRLSEMSEQRETHERPVPADGDEVEHGDGPRETSVYAARLLEQATVNAELLVAEAQAAADELRNAAQNEADELRNAARNEAEELRTTALTEAATVAAELERNRAQVLGEVAEVQAELEARIANLRRQESDSRERLRRHLTEQLALLDAAPTARLRAVAD